MKQNTSKTDYFIKIALMLVGGVTLAFLMSAHIWNIIHREDKLAYSIDYIEEFRLDYGDEKLGKIRFQNIYYQVRFSDGNRWGGLATIKSKSWQEAKAKFHSVLKVDTADLQNRIPLRMKRDDFKKFSEKGILAIRSKKKGWELLKIGDGYLVNSEFTKFELALLYLVFFVFILIGIFSIAGAIYLLIKDSSSKSIDLTYIPGKWDGLMYILRGFKHEERGKNGGESTKKNNQN